MNRKCSRLVFSYKSGVVYASQQKHYNTETKPKVRSLSIPTLEFTATSHHDHVKIDQDLAIGGAVHLNIRLEDLNYPSQLLVMKNGLHYANLPVPTGQSFEHELIDTKPGKGYYRLELYAKTRDGCFEAVHEW